ncbi:hypothetical protein EC957_011325 [Mortierella hygrophila]|uniref:Uncharacterized protein n=1 Tax=Mortierella hygrophila TaxID=979708 RepID=A0A9P6EW82_9FUNG|nr:hypothetical protein EC957_011325 [Mortierella hygrophila]
MKLRSLLSAATIQSEHDKNTRTVEKILHGSILEEGIKRTRAITVLITTADITDDALQQLNMSLPDNSLFIYRRALAEFIGNAFSIPIALAVSKDFNLNVATRETLRKKHKLEDKRGGPNSREYALPYRLESIEHSTSTQLYTLSCVDGEDVLLFYERTETLADALNVSDMGQRTTDIIFHALPGDGQEKVLR